MKIIDEIKNDKEIKRFGHRIGDPKVKRRFGKFMEWFGDEVQIKDIRNDTIKYFKGLLYLEETIANDSEKWRLTLKIIEQFINERQFAILIKNLDNNKFEIVSSDESSSDDEKYMSEIEFWEKYQKIQHYDDEFVIGELVQLTMKLKEGSKKIEETLQQIINELQVNINVNYLRNLVDWEIPYEEIKIMRVVKEYMEITLKYQVIEEVKERREEIIKLMNYAMENKITVNEMKLTRLYNMGYDENIIFEEGFLENFREVKDELESHVIKELELWLAKKRKKKELIIEDFGNESNDKKSEGLRKIGEILSPDGSENNENFEEYDEENIINRPDFDSSSNSNLESSELFINPENFEDSDIESNYNLQELFQENNLNMADANQVQAIFREEIRNFARNQYGNDLGNDLGNPNPNIINNTLGNINATRGLVVEFPLFGGSENEDEQNGIAKRCIVGIARDWLRTEEANITNWDGGDNNTSLDRRIVIKYANDEIKKRWQDELENIK
ncbi:hypothetical protein C1646_776414 [Rhizophagus diaphanus]|nr:hypothetical protein C1646_776414 [Rhizophagus diaphanus] [Rhizophagus sp. MUCL 43196]